MSEIKEFSDLINRGYSIEIPAYQRAYSWGEAQIKQFVDDLIEMKGEDKDGEEVKDKAYYYGHFILEENKEGKKFEVVDGQQRITTYVLFLLAAKLYTDYEITEEQKRFIKYKFKTISYDCEKFEELVKKVIDDNKLIELLDNETSSIKRMHNAIESFEGVFKEDMQIGGLIKTLEAAKKQEKKRWQLRFLNYKIREE